MLDSQLNFRFRVRLSARTHPCLRGVAVRQLPPARRPDGRRLSAAGHLRALPPHRRQRRAHGLRLRPPRHADHRQRRTTRASTPTRDRRPLSPKILETWERLGICFDLYTTTLTENHYAATQEIFLTLLEAGLPLQGTAGTALRSRRPTASCPTATSRAPARTAATPKPAATSATTAARRSTPIELINPRSRSPGATPELRAVGALLPRAQRLRGAARRVGAVSRRTGGGTSSTLRSGWLERRAAGSRDHARHRVGRAGPGRGLRGQAHLRLVRGRHRLPLRDARMGAEVGRPRGLAALLGGPGRRAPTTSSARTTSRSTP